MIRATTIVCACLILMSGCTNRTSTPILIGTNKPATSLEEGQKSERDNNSGGSFGSDELVDNSNNRTVEDELNTTAPTDLFDAIRSEFVLSPLQSDWIDNQIKWNVEHPTYLNNLFARARPFLFYIYEELRNRGMPGELILLPAIESAFKPRAVSRSRAAGLWQFMPATGRYFGLENDWWYDGRLDFIESTNAALNYLQRLHKQFDGDWWLAMAAYNAGPGTVKRAIQKNQRLGKATDYQSLDLRLETRRYVPKLLALRAIVNNPKKYGVQLPDFAITAGFSVIDLESQIDMRKFSDSTDINLNELRHINAGHKRWATAPRQRLKFLLPATVDLRTIDLNTAVQDSQVAYLHHRVERGDSLHKLANRFKLSVSALKKANNLRGNTIRAGHSLLIPVSDGEHAKLSPGLPVENKFDRAPDRVHTVSAGDTLWSISKRYSVGIQELMDWNRIAVDQVLRLNQELLIFAP